MLNLFNISHEELNSKLNDLSSKIESAQSFIFNPSKSDWDNIFELCTQIAEHFKNVRYPTKAERDIAWQRFYNLRNSAFNLRNSQSYNRSKKYYDELMSQLSSADYHALEDFVVGHVLSLGLLKTTADDMKYKGKELGRIGGYFKSVKHEMTKEHKAQVHERMIEVRQNHDGFWGKWKSYNEEKSKIYEQKQQALEEKQEKSRQIKARIESNLEGNKEKLYKAKDALDRFERKRDELRDKIYDSHSDNWKSKAESWLDEFNDKIRDIEEQIDRIEKWIEEDKDKLRNWN